MNAKEVKKLVGTKGWAEFSKWMRGQTVGVNKDGSYDYYSYDVERFMSTHNQNRGN